MNLVSQQYKDSDIMEILTPKLASPPGGGILIRLILVELDVCMLIPVVEIHITCQY